jgi:hypothetical protein
LPRRTPDATPRSPSVDAPARAPLPNRPRALPSTRTPVRSVPAPAPWGLGDPLPGPGYDPFTVAPPTPTPRPAPAPRAVRPRVPVGFPDFPWLDVPGRSVPRLEPGTRPSPLTPQQPRSPPRTSRPPKAPTDLTPIQDPVPPSLAQPQPRPTQSNPCTAQRAERRRRQKKCREFTTKTIRVCAD